eukprot:4357042-Lingulodinium_polyedra.AAC.1
MVGLLLGHPCGWKQPGRHDHRCGGQGLLGGPAVGMHHHRPAKPKATTQCSLVVGFRGASRQQCAGGAGVHAPRLL